MLALAVGIGTLSATANGLDAGPRTEAGNAPWFFQWLRVSEKYPGTGNGLAMCKKIVVQNGGHIWVESEAGEGSTFCFSLSGSSRKLLSGLPPSHRESPIMKKTTQKILLIEDNPADAALFQEQLAGAAGTFEIATCGDLAAGRQLAAGGQIAVVFLDLSLTESDGLETVRRAQVAFHDLPIVVLTGLEDAQLGLESLRAGAQDYLIKGKTSAENISRAARYAIERQRVLRELQLAHDQLEEKIQQRTAELAATVQSLQEEVRQRKQAEDQLSVRASQLRALAGELTLA